MHKQVLINVEASDLRVAILENGILTELFVERFNAESILGNVYKGRVEGIVPGLKAVFVNIGREKNAFLHFSDVLREFDLPLRGRPLREAPPKVKPNGNGTEEKAEPAEIESSGGEGEDEYIDPQVLPGEEAEDDLDEEEAIKPRKARSRTLRVGDPIMVQVIKEPINTKGARITSYISMPGRYLVMMPFAERRGGVSRKIEDASQRRRLRDLLRSLKAETGSFIVRTAGIDESEDAIREDYDFLVDEWKKIKRNNLKATAPALTYDESNILQRLVRDTFRNDIDEILIDSRSQMRELIKAAQKMAPVMVDRIHLYESAKNIFEVFEVEQQFQKALRRKVWTKTGGFLVIDETEALTAIDVNSGKYVGSEDQDQVILKTNMAACETVSRQLKLRDLGGLIVIDFIDMTNRDHQKQVMRELERCLNRDEAKYALSGFSDFGLVEMTRKRVRMSLAKSIYSECPYCEGAGRILNESQTWKQIKYELLRKLEADSDIEAAEVLVHSQIRSYLEEEAVSDIRGIAGQYSVALKFVSRPDYHHEQFDIITSVKSTKETKKKAPTRRRTATRNKKTESEKSVVESSGAGPDNSG